MSGRRRGRRPHARPSPNASSDMPAPRARHDPEQAAPEPILEAAPIVQPAAVAVVAPPEGLEAAPESGDRKASCTLAQLRRFVKSRPYVPLHELRRRFGIEGDDDEVSPVQTDRGLVFVGLPDAEARLLGELVRAGDVGYELLYDPSCPAIVGVYPMRPVARG